MAAAPAPTPTPSPTSTLGPTRTYSFELFPPRSAETKARLEETIRQLAALGPAYFSVTYGAGGSDQEGTYDTLMAVIEGVGCEAAPHLTCVGSTRERIAGLLDRYRQAGVRRIVALRGDLPATSISAEAPGDFHFANQLVSFIRETHGEHFQIEVAAYPEMHPQAGGVEDDLQNFVRKVQAGAHAAITQYFFNCDCYFDFVDRCAAAGVTVPIVPGVMPIVNAAQLIRFSAACGADIPRWLRLRIEALAEDRQALLDFGTEVVARLCERLLAGGAPGIHFYTLNQVEPTRRLWAHLGLGPVATA
jgi:methylenetetrahydrofolate reductase (NADPH)